MGLTGPAWSHAAAEQRRCGAILAVSEADMFLTLFACTGDPDPGSDDTRGQDQLTLAESTDEGWDETSLTAHSDDAGESWELLVQGN